MSLSVIVAAGFIGSIPSPAAAGAARDTAVVALPPVEITALRGHDRLLDVPATSFVIPRQALIESGVSRLSSLLATLPGLYAYQQSASGDPTVVDPRGFTANGERSYLKLLVNGQDVRDVENGAVDWDWLVPGQIERVEVVEGAGAWAYGDGSEGGIVNVVPVEPGEGVRPDVAVRAGSFGMRTGALEFSGRRGGVGGTLRGSLRHVDGWRDRSRERVHTAGGDLGWSLSDRTRVSLDAAWIDADREDPGTLTPDRLRVERTAAESRYDMNRGRRLAVGGHLRTVAPDGSEWSFSPVFRAEIVDQVRSLFTQTPIAQAKWHPSRSWTGGLEGSWRRSFRVAGRDLGLAAGGLAERSKLRSTYFDYSAGEIGALRTRTQSWRTTGSVWADARVPLDDATTARVGFRQDGIRLFSKDLVEETLIPPHTWWSSSPMIALNRRIGGRASAYASYGSAFRVASLSQMFDRRPIDFGTTFYLSNPSLEPQRAHSVELGGRWDGADGTLAMLTLYSIWVRHEIDFDAATFSYANLDRSWHRGVQVAGRRPLPAGVAIEVNGTYSPTTIRGGESDGNQINAVPRGTAYGGLAWKFMNGWSASGGVRYVGRQYLDKANQHRIPDFATVELGLTARLERVRASIRIGNLLQRDYADTGYLLDLGALGTQERLSPGAPRSVSLSFTSD